MLSISNFLELIKIYIVTINKTPLMLRCENSIISDVSESVGIILPLQVGHVAPHPSPDPVALTNAPARIESTERSNPSFV